LEWRTQFNRHHRSVVKFNAQRAVSLRGAFYGSPGDDWSKFSIQRVPSARRIDTVFGVSIRRAEGIPIMKLDADSTRTDTIGLKRLSRLISPPLDICLAQFYPEHRAAEENRGKHLHPMPGMIECHDRLQRPCLYKA